MATSIIHAGIFGLELLLSPAVRDSVYAAHCLGTRVVHTVPENSFLPERVLLVYGKEDMLLCAIYLLRQGDAYAVTRVDSTSELTDKMGAWD